MTTSLEAFRIVNRVVQVWDSPQQKWSYAFVKHMLTPEQASKRHEITNALIEIAQLKREERMRTEEQIKSGPEAYLHSHLHVLRTMGYAPTTETVAMKQIFDYLLELGERFKKGHITWGAFTQEVIDWAALISNKLEAVKCLTES